MSAPDSLKFDKPAAVEHLENVGAITQRGIINEDLVRTWSDKVGRKWAMVVADIAFTLGAAVIACSYSVGQVVAGRIILGVGVGGASVIAPLYISELAPTAVRGRCIGTNGFFVPFGQIVSSAVGAGVGHRVKGGWRLLFALGVIPSIVQLCLMHWLPESPRIQVMKGKREEAIVTLRKVYSNASDEIIALKLRIIEDNIRESSRLTDHLSFTQMAAKLWTHKPYRRAIISVSVVQAFGQLTGYNALLYYSGTIFSLLGFKNAAAAGIIPSGGNALFLLVGISIVDRVVLTKETGGLLDATATYPTGILGSLLAAIVCFIICFGLSLSHIIWCQSEFLALEIRAAGSAISSTALWLANLIISVSYLSMLNTLTPSGTYGLYAGFCALGFTFCLFCYPETKGLSIDETDQLFKDGYGVKRSIEMRKEKAAYSKQLKEEADDIKA
ncbi:hypothetical protein MNV49_000422 [Pseudohyphozyma bogoriensis]|nr:hypothetical protein MNV49_000422 [Pseudohyphozyma bogoriensis]